MLYVHQRTKEPYELVNKIAGKVRLRSLATGNIRKVDDNQFLDYFFHYINEPEEAQITCEENEELEYVSKITEGIRWEQMWDGINRDYQKEFIPVKPKSKRKPKAKPVVDRDLPKSNKERVTKKKVKEPTSGLIKLKDICKDAGKARRVLRKYPDLATNGKWEWFSTSPSLKKVKELIKDC